MSQGDVMPRIRRRPRTLSGPYLFSAPPTSFHLEPHGHAGRHRNFSQGPGGEVVERAGNPVKSMFYTSSSELTWSSQWHKYVRSAARGRNSETISATPITSPSGAGT